MTIELIGTIKRATMDSALCLDGRGKALHLAITEQLEF